MKKGFFLMAAMAALFNNKSYGGVSIDKANKSLKNCPSYSHGGKSTKNVWTIMYKKVQTKKTKNRIAKQSRNINHKKAA